MHVSGNRARSSERATMRVFEMVHVVRAVAPSGAARAAAAATTPAEDACRGSVAAAAFSGVATFATAFAACAGRAGV